MIYIDINECKFENMLNLASRNLTICDAITKAKSVLSKYDKVMCTISGGKDSDVVIDILANLDKDKKIMYVFFDTGLEMSASKEHITYIEEKYVVKVHRIKPKVQVVPAIRKHGEPFCSKYVSEMISRLQKHGFLWQDEPYEVLESKFPNCKSALRWWTNTGVSRQFCIAQHRGLKEFMIKYPPTFKVSAQCCEYAKKSVIYDMVKKNDVELSVNGVRKSEGGVRKTIYKNCFQDSSSFGSAVYRPIFWFKKSDIDEYCNIFNITHSKCYSLYGLKRTGCAACPFGRERGLELEALEKHEQNLFKGVQNVFKNTFEYTRMYEDYKNNMAI